MLVDNERQCSMLMRRNTPADRGRNETNCEEGQPEPYKFKTY